MNRFYYIYLITNLSNNKQYVGSKMYDCETPGKVYMGSSKYVNEDIELLGIENFSKIFIEENMLFVNRKELCERESYYMHLYDTLNPKGYNKYDPGKCSGFSQAGISPSSETRNKISKTLKGKKRSIESIEKGRKSSIGLKHSEETKKKCVMNIKDTKKELHVFYLKKA